MAVSRRLKWYLEQKRIEFRVLPHAPSGSSRGTAQAAHVEREHLAKCVLLEDERGYLLAVLPASRRIALGSLRRALERPLELASEAELGDIFDDCALGAVPPVGPAYGIPTIVDERLLHLTDVYFEGGDHESLVHVTGADFSALWAGLPRGDISDEGDGDEPSVRARAARVERLEEAAVHVFSLRAYGQGLRRQPEYEKGGHTGMILVKTPELSVVLEAASAGTAIAPHVVHGPVTLLVLDGALDVRAHTGTFRVGESEMAVLPRDEHREIRALVASLFLIALGRRAPDLR